MVDVAQLVESRIVIPVVAGSSPVVHPIMYGPLAQLVEQLTLNQRVVGSIPTRPIKNQVLSGSFPFQGAHHLRTQYSNPKSVYSFQSSEAHKLVAVLVSSSDGTLPLFHCSL
jgi:hypothetical protein